MFTARSEGSDFGTVTFLLVYEISQEPLNGFASNSQGRHIWSRTRTSLNIKVTRDKKAIFRPFRWPACGLFGETSLASTFVLTLLCYCLLS